MIEAYIPKVKYINAMAFEECDSLKTVVISDYYFRNGKLHGNHSILWGIQNGVTCIGHTQYKKCIEVMNQVRQARAQCKQRISEVLRD